MNSCLLQNTADRSLSEVARVAISLVCLDARFEHAAREIGTVLGSLLAEPFTDSVPLPMALTRLREACCEAGFVQCEVLQQARDTAQFRLHGCQQVLAGSVPVVGRLVCGFDVGFFEGFLQHLAGDQSLTVSETTCIGRGDAFCEFGIRRGHSPP
jgi:predicted hydrocarbon binding protein